MNQSINLRKESQFFHPCHTTLQTLSSNAIKTAKKNAKTPGVQFQAFWGVNEVLALCYCKTIQAIPKYAHAPVGFSIDLISGSGEL